MSTHIIVGELVAAVQLESSLGLALLDDVTVGGRAEQAEDQIVGTRVGIADRQLRGSCGGQKEDSNFDGFRFKNFGFVGKAESNFLLCDKIVYVCSLFSRLFINFIVNYRKILESVIET